MKNKKRLTALLAVVAFVLCLAVGIIVPVVQSSRECSTAFAYTVPDDSYQFPDYDNSIPYDYEAGVYDMGAVPCYTDFYGPVSTYIRLNSVSPAFGGIYIEPYNYTSYVGCIYGYKYVYPDGSAFSLFEIYTYETGWADPSYRYWVMPFQMGVSFYFLYSTDLPGSSVARYMTFAEYLSSLDTSEEDLQAEYNKGFQAGKLEGIQAGIESGKEQGYQEGYQSGYQAGLKDGSSSSSGYQEGYNDGYEQGYQEGMDHMEDVARDPNSDIYQETYQEGYNNGLNKGLSSSLSNPLTFFVSSVNSFLNTKLFGDFAIGDCLSIVLYVSIALIFIKMFAGG